MLLLHHLQEFFPDGAVQHPPHMRRIPVQIRQQQNIQLGQVIRDDGQGHPGKVHSADGQLFPDFFLRAELPACLDLNDHFSIGALPYQIRKTLGTLCSGVPGRLIVRIGQHILRRRGRFRPASGQLQSQQPRQGQKVSSVHCHPSRG